MSKELFVFEGNQVRWLQESDRILFCATDVAKALGYSNPRDAISKHCKGVAFYDTLNTAGGAQQVRFIAEPDLYRLIVHSKLPTAAEFERLVFEEILPSINKHGAYMTDEALEKALTSPDFLIQLATQLKDEQQKRRALEQQAAIDAPKVAFADAVTVSNSCILIRDLAKLLTQNGITIEGKAPGEKRLFAWMRANGYLMKARRGSSSYNLPTQKAANLGLFRVQEWITQKADATPAIRMTTRVTGKGQRYFLDVLAKQQQESENGGKDYH